MDKEISWHVELRIKPGQLDSFRALTGEMVAFTRREAGALSYQRFVSADGTTLHIYERYITGLVQIGVIQKFLEQLRGTCNATRPKQSIEASFAIRVSASS
jgi:hypothetical protein